MRVAEQAGTGTLVHERELLLEAFSLLVQRQAETEAALGQQLGETSSRVAAAERRSKELEARLTELGGRLEELARAVEPDPGLAQRVAALQVQLDHLQARRTESAPAPASPPPSAPPPASSAAALSSSTPMRQTQVTYAPAHHDPPPVEHRRFDADSSLVHDPPPLRGEPAPVGYDARPALHDAPPLDHRRVEAEPRSVRHDAAAERRPIEDDRRPVHHDPPPLEHRASEYAPPLRGEAAPGAYSARSSRGQPAPAAAFRANLATASGTLWDRLGAANQDRASLVMMGAGVLVVIAAAIAQLRPG